MRCLSLFTGIGGIDLGLQWAGMEIVGQCEIDLDCHLVLNRHFGPNMPRWTNIEDMRVSDVIDKCEQIDIIAGGVPCQGFSVAGKGLGFKDDRSKTWWQMWRLVRRIRPRWVLVENVPAIRTRGVDWIYLSLESLGYTVRAFVVGAEAVGAPHRRERMWLVGNLESVKVRSRDMSIRITTEQPIPASSGTEVGHNDRSRSEGDGISRRFDGSSVQLGNDNSINGGTGPVEDRRGLVEAVSLQSESLGASSVVSMANPYRERLRLKSRRRCRTCGLEAVFTFPAGQGFYQHPGEASRTVAAKSRVVQATDGLSAKMALKMLGNSVVPQVVYAIGNAIMLTDASILCSNPLNLEEINNGNAGKHGC